jgi:uncharacterized protein involved in oxidation of intracellular sulfur
MTDLTIIVNDAPYGLERAWNALRLALATASGAVKSEVKVFLLGDAVSIAKRGQRPPGGYYNLESMLVDLIEKGVRVKACGSCLSARGLDITDLVDGVEKGSMMGLSEWINESRNVVSF